MTWHFLMNTKVKLKGNVKGNKSLEESWMAKQSKPKAKLKASIYHSSIKASCLCEELTEQTLDPRSMSRQSVQITVRMTVNNRILLASVWIIGPYAFLKYENNTWRETARPSKSLSKGTLVINVRRVGGESQLETTLFRGLILLMLPWECTYNPRFLWAWSTSVLIQNILEIS